MPETVAFTSSNMKKPVQKLTFFPEITDPFISFFKLCGMFPYSKFKAIKCGFLLLSLVYLYLMLMTFEMTLVVYDEMMSQVGDTALMCLKLGMKLTEESTFLRFF